MAPEQWENSAAADIRADIYSLGCTLFFLLTGKPPYGDPAYDTNRKKLMAHVVAPIPSLVENCPDCPQDLEEVYETMMAKDPRERYAVPAEAAEAMAEFADEEELAEVLAADGERRCAGLPQAAPIFAAPRWTRPGSKGPDRWGRTPAVARSAGGLPSRDSAGIFKSFSSDRCGRDFGPRGLGGDAARRRTV